MLFSCSYLLITGLIETLKRAVILVIWQVNSNMGLMSTGHRPMEPLLAPSKGALSLINRTSLPPESPRANWPQQ